MPEDTLRYFSIDVLYHLMLKNIDELLAMQEEDKSLIEIEEKQEQIKLLQSVITAKKAENKTDS